MSLAFLSLQAEGPQGQEAAPKQKPTTAAPPLYLSRGLLSVHGKLLREYSRKKLPLNKEMNFR